MASSSGGRIYFQPDKLQRLCQDFIATHLTQTIAYETSHDLLELRSDAFLPAETAEGIISAYNDEGLILTDKVIHLLRDATRTKICSVDLSHSQITDWSLQWLSQHPIARLDISGCNELSQQGDIQTHITKIQSTLRVLILGDKGELFLSGRPLSNDMDMMEDTLMLPQPYAAEDLDDFPPPAVCQPEDERSSDEEEEEQSTTPRVILDAPNLAVLCLNEVQRSSALIQHLIEPLQNLQSLDLSNCGVHLPNMHCLRNLPRLKSLTLHDVLPQGFNLYHFLNILSKLTTLCHLDISVTRKMNQTTRYPPMIEQDRALASLVGSLPKLTSLDISGTHLAGQDEAETDNSDYIPIKAFEGRHFEFLGLFDCVEDVCARRHLPADRITGRSNINQLLESLRVYTKRRPAYTSDALSDLYTQLKEGPRNQIKDYSECLSLIGDIMRRNKDNLDRQILASAAMYYMVSSRISFPDLHDYASPRLIRKSIRALYDAMDTHFGDKSMLKNGLLTLCNFTLPDDIMFIYKDIVVILLLVIRHSDVHERSDNFLQRLSLYLLNNVVRSVDNVEKLLVGDQGAVKTMLWVIRNKVRQETKPDEILEMAWSALWNITDETPQNCERFLDGAGDDEGLNLFIDCYNKFCIEPSDGGRSSGVIDLDTGKLREAVLRNMMGLLGNVAEVQSLRQRFLRPIYLNLFSELLGSHSDGIEVSYNAAGIICHILFDGNDLSKYVKPNNQVSQTVSQPTDQTFRMMDSTDSEDEETTESHPANQSDAATSTSQTTETCDIKPSILESLTKAIRSWDTGSSRSINYRSFKPILKLLKCEHTVEVRYWAVWALCNLTTVYAQKYCPLLKEEGGIVLLEELQKNPDKQNNEILQLIRITLFNCTQYFENPY